jgi:hypothetical protein
MDTNDISEPGNARDEFIRRHVPCLLRCERAIAKHHGGPLDGTHLAALYLVQAAAVLGRTSSDPQRQQRLAREALELFRDYLNFLPGVSL